MLLYNTHNRLIFPKKFVGEHLIKTVYTLLSLHKPKSKAQSNFLKIFNGKLQITLTTTSTEKTVTANSHVLGLCLNHKTVNKTIGAISRNAQTVKALVCLFLKTFKSQLAPKNIWCIKKIGSAPNCKL